MIKNPILVLMAVVIVLVGFSLQGGSLLSTAEASSNLMALSDCAGMADMSGGHDSMDCLSMDDEGQDSSMKCPAENCTPRCGMASASIAVLSVNGILPIGSPELWPDLQVYVSAAGKPPLRPPCSSILA